MTNDKVIAARTAAIARGELESYETPAFWRKRARVLNGYDAYMAERRARDLEDLYGFVWEA